MDVTFHTFKIISKTLANNTRKADLRNEIFHMNRDEQSVEIHTLLLIMSKFYSICMEGGSGPILSIYHAVYLISQIFWQQMGPLKKYSNTVFLILNANDLVNKTQQAW